MKKKIAELLFVEDNPFDAELTINALKAKNLANELHHVEDGAQALDFIYARGSFSHRADRPFPSLVLLDLKMPKIDGLEVLRTLKSDPVTKGIPVVVLTSSKEDPDIRKCYELGVNSYIVKPVGFEKFVQAVTELGLYWALLNTTPETN